MSSPVVGTHILVIPFPAQGHMPQILDLTHQLAIRGLAISILVTTKNLPVLKPLLSTHPTVQSLVLPFPPHPSVPAGVENMQELSLDFLPDILCAFAELHNPLLHWIQSHPSPPVAIISDVLFGPWTHPLAQHLGIKPIGFTPTNAHSLCSWWVDIVDNKNEIDIADFSIEVANMASWGLIVNSYTELERDYLDQLKSKFLRHDRVWPIGPLLPIKDEKLATTRVGGPSSIPVHEVMEWLDSCHVDGLVVYVGFGSQITLKGRQMEELAAALEESRVRFIWSVKDPMKGGQDDQSVVPTGFEDRVAGRGLVIRGWAPQVAILGHRAVGAYLTHCGWNSALEGLLAGVVLLAWPMQADHYFNTKLLVDELGTAVRVCEGLDTIPDRVNMARVLTESVGGTHEPRRVRAMELRRLALEAIKEGGSSCNALDELVKELSRLKSNNN